MRHPSKVGEFCARAERKRLKEAQRGKRPRRTTQTKARAKAQHVPAKLTAQALAAAVLIAGRQR